MPSRNRVKQWAPERVYHLYNRGNNKQAIFADKEDYAVFLNLIKRHLAKKQSKDKLGRLYKNWHTEIELIAFCLMPNHYHLLAYQKNQHDITQFVTSVTVSYTGYFNKKYNRIGRMFQDTFKASLVDEDVYWQHLSRYIHLNPRNWLDWEWTSLPYFLGQKQTDWVKPKRLLNTFEGSSYMNFMKDYEGHKNMLDELRHIKAD